MRLVGVVFLLVLISGCLSLKQARTGRDAYDTKQYSRAIELYEQEISNTKLRKEILREKEYRLAKSYDMLGRYARAKTYFHQAYEHGYGLAALRDLGYAYKKTGDYRSALNCFERLSKKVSSDPRISKEVFTLKSIIKSETKSALVNVRIHTAASGYNDYAPTLYGSQRLLITSDRTDDSDPYLWTGNGFSDFYVLGTSGGDFEDPILKIINSPGNDGSACFNKDGTEVYFTRCHEDKNVETTYCMIYVSELKDEYWQEARLLTFQQSGFNYGQPALLENDEVLVFASDMEGSRGGKDLFYSERIYAADSTYVWSQPEPMPQTINTEGEDLFPVGYGDTLYYSSDGLSGYGGLDIYKTYLHSDGYWTAPERLSPPINSSGDDMSYVKDKYAPLPNTGYFASNREGLGGDDIYAFYPVHNQEEDNPTDVDTSLIAEEPIQVYLAITTYEQGTDRIKSKLGGVSLVLGERSEAVTFGTTDGSGRYITEIEPDGSLMVKARKEGYFSKEERIRLDGEYVDGETINVTLAMEPIRFDTEITLESIYYDYDDWRIRDDARPTLDSLAHILQTNPQLKVRLGSHTDCRGEEGYNLILSQKRAQAAIDYLRNKGVTKRRLKAVGYGESQLIDTCECDTCSEENHQRNRRTTVTFSK